MNGYYEKDDAEYRQMVAEDRALEKRKAEDLARIKRKHAEEERFDAIQKRL